MKLVSTSDLNDAVYLVLTMFVWYTYIYVFDVPILGVARQPWHDTTLSDYQ